MDIETICTRGDILSSTEKLYIMLSQQPGIIRVDMGRQTQRLSRGNEIIQVKNCEKTPENILLSIKD